MIDDSSRTQSNVGKSIYLTPTSCFNRQYINTVKTWLVKPFHAIFDSYPKQEKNPQKKYQSYCTFWKSNEISLISIFRKKKILNMYTKKHEG